MLKRILPFILTLTLGVALGSLFNFARPRAARAPHAFEAPPPPVFSGGGCRSSRARRELYMHRRHEDSPRPVILFKPEPRYTEAARKNSVSGLVRLSAMFGADGRVSAVEALTTLPDGLTEEAIRAAEGIVFKPATLGGEPVSVRSDVEYVFRTY